MRGLHINVLTLSLILIGLGVVYVKVTSLGLPLRPDVESYIWSVEARVEFNGTGRAATVDLLLPPDQQAYIRLDEYFISRNYGLTVESRGQQRTAEWSIRRARGPQRLYYQMELAPPTAATEADDDSRVPKPPDKPDYPEALGLVVEGLLSDVRSESSNIFTFVSQLLVRMNSATPDSDIRSITRDLTPGSEAWVERIQYVLAGAQITTRMLRGLPLEDGRVNESLLPWLEVHNGEHWEGFDPRSGEKGYPPDFLRWTTGANAVLNVTNGNNAQISFAVARRPQALTMIAHERARVLKSPLVSWSLLKLPMNTQYVYKILILIPLGALVVIFMRTIIGIPTIGTFMSVLIALSFRETELLWGLALFLFIVSAGLLFRFYLNHLHLLLVARLSAVLTLVVLLMLAISLLSNELGLVQGFSIALFPIVILTMVIERMSITWDEFGPLESFKEGLGSLAVAVLGYLVMNNDQLQHMMFVFPELLLVVLALCILAGSYTGYRLSELLRFRDLVREIQKDKENVETGP